MIGAVAVYIFAKMFYLQRSGLPQIADLFIAASLPFIANGEALRTTVRANPIPLFFLAWVAIVNLVWYALTHDVSFLRYTSFYAFNAAIFYVAAQTVLMKREKALDAIKTAAVVSGLVQLAFVVTDSGGFRGTGTFQNPNQLAYWGLCSATLYILGRRGPVTLVDLAVLLMFASIEGAAVSRAGLAATAVLIAIWMATNFRRSGRIFLIAGLVATLAAPAAIYVGGDRLAARMSVADKLEKRMQQRQSVNELSNRNIDRVFDNVVYIGFGAGEGGYDRFTESRGALEIHSSFVTALFSYGVVGLLLFLALLGRTAMLVRWHVGIYILPLLLYGLTHNGLRFSYFWLVLGLMTGVSHITANIASAGQRGRPVRFAMAARN